MKSKKDLSLVEELSDVEEDLYINSKLMKVIPYLIMALSWYWIGGLRANFDNNLVKFLDFIANTLAFWSIYIAINCLATFLQTIAKASANLENLTKQLSQKK